MDRAQEPESTSNSDETTGEVAGSSSNAPLSQQMALQYTQQLFKNAPTDGKIHALVDLVLPVSERGACDESAAPAAVSSLDKTDNHDYCPDPPDMRREDERLKTFEKWPVTFLRPQTLASNGFYYLGRGDEVRCAFCKVEIMRWEEGDDPAADHRRWAPQCPFLRRCAGVGNVPLDGAAPGGGGGVDECGVRAPAPRMPGPVHPAYASEAARLRSFRDWPRSMRQKPEDLADAGFFYTGQGDKTKCFYCDGGLKDWEDDDVPWEQHARWFDRCAFVQLVKGRDYVQKVMSEAAVIRAPKEGSSDKESVVKEETPASPQPAVTTPAPAPAASPAPAPAPAPADPPKKPEPTSDVDDSKLCKICFAQELNICFLPCGHVVACARCALATDKCPMCRRTFVNAVRVYFS